MSENELPVGQRFSQVYMRSSTTATDSQRARFRLGKLIGKAIVGREQQEDFAGVLEGELGIPVMSNIYTVNMNPYDENPLNLGDFTRETTLRDLLDCIPMCFKYLESSRPTDMRPEEFLVEVQRIFEAEAMAYRLDERGGPHPLVDTSFDWAIVSVLEGLGSERFAQARSLIEAMERALLASSFDGRTAIRAVFGAAENVFKMTLGGSALNKKAIRERLGPKLQQIHPDGGEELRAANRSLDGFVEWVDAAHNFRHQDDKTTIVQPPRDLTIHMVSCGMAHVRWLAAMS